MGMLARLSRQIESPPTWLLAAILLAWVQAAHLPVWPTGRIAGGLGLVLILAGIVLMAAAVFRFGTTGTTILPREVPQRLITTGPYRYSRNPIYLADALILLGLVLRWDLGSLPLVGVFVWIITTRFVRGEEAGCAAVFGDAWRSYAGKTGRWLSVPQGRNRL